MNTMLKQLAMSVCVWLVANHVWASGDDHRVSLESPKISVLDQTSLQRGAQIYAQYCMGCHSLKHLRINRAAKDLGWSDEVGVRYLQHIRLGKGKPTDMIETTLNPETAQQAFGHVPPDLTLETRVRGKDWVYTFLTHYQRDANGQVSNALFPGVAMPFILEGLQQKLPEAEFKSAVADLVNFMDYAAEPAKPKRLMLGWWVLGFLSLLVLLTYLLKKEFWRDVHSS